MARASAVRRLLDDLDARERRERAERAAASAAEARREREKVRAETSARSGRLPAGQSERATQNSGDTRDSQSRLLRAARRLASLRALGIPDLISRADVERRVRRACLTHEVSPRVRGPQARVYWPEVLTEWADLIARAENSDNLETEALRIVFEPTPADLADELVAMGWMLFLTGARRLRCAEPAAGRGWNSGQAASPGACARPAARSAVARSTLSDWQIVYLAATGWGWREIGRRMGTSDATARRRFDGAIDQCWRAANIEAGAQAAGARDRAR